MKWEFFATQCNTRQFKAPKRPQPGMIIWYILPKFEVCNFLLFSDQAFYFCNLWYQLPIVKGCVTIFCVRGACKIPLHGKRGEHKQAPPINNSALFFSCANKKHLKSITVPSAWFNAFFSFSGHHGHYCKVHRSIRFHICALNWPL